MNCSPDCRLYVRFREYKLYLGSISVLVFGDSNVLRQLFNVENDKDALLLPSGIIEDMCERRVRLHSATF